MEKEKDGAKSKNLLPPISKNQNNIVR
jgi:hypothetical protein